MAMSVRARWIEGAGSGHPIARKHVPNRVPNSADLTAPERTQRNRNPCKTTQPASK